MPTRKSTSEITTSDKLSLRLPIGMRLALKTRAMASGRSINAEAVAILGLALYSESYATLLPEDDLLHEVSLRFGIEGEAPPTD